MDAEPFSYQSCLSPADKVYWLILALQRPLARQGVLLGLCEAHYDTVVFLAESHSTLDMAFSLLSSRTATFPWLVTSRQEPSGPDSACLLVTPDERSWYAREHWPLVRIALASPGDPPPCFRALGPFFVLAHGDVAFEPPARLVSWDDEGL
jgi:hypothetical protein